MAASAPLKVYGLYDVDGTILNNNGNINGDLLVFLGHFQDFLSREEVRISLRQHLFTSRFLDRTLEYIYSDICEKGVPPTECLASLVNLVGYLKAEFERELDEIIPVIQGGDALAECKVGEFFKDVQSGFERSLLASNAKLLRDMESYVELKKAEGVDVFSVFASNVEIAFRALPSEQVANMQILVDCCKDQALVTTQMRSEGKRCEDKCAILAKVLEQCVADDALFLWVDDRADLYAMAVKEESIKINGRNLGEVVKERVVFIHEVAKVPNESGEVEVTSTATYYDRLIAALEGCTHSSATRLKEICLIAKENVIEEENEAEVVDGSADVSTEACGGAGISSNSTAFARAWNGEPNSKRSRTGLEGLEEQSGSEEELEGLTP